MKSFVSLPHVPMYRQRQVLSCGRYNGSSASPWHIRMFRHKHRNKVRSPLRPSWADWFRRSRKYR